MKVDAKQFDAAIYSQATLDEVGNNQEKQVDIVGSLQQDSVNISNEAVDLERFGNGKLPPE